MKKLSECSTVEDFIDYYLYPELASKSELKSMLEIVEQKSGETAKNHKKAIKALLSANRKLVIQLHKSNS